MKQSLIACWGVAAMLLGAPAVQAQQAVTAAPAARLDDENEGIETAVRESGDAVANLWVQEAYEQLATGNPEASLELFSRALNREPENVRARAGAGLALIRLNRAVEALEALEPLIEEYPDDYSLKNNVAWIYATASESAVRDSERALDLARQALLMAPRDYHVWSTLSEAYHAAGRYERALQSAEEALALARALEAPEARLRNYARQVEKNRRALEAAGMLN